MATKSYLPKDDRGKLALLKHFSANLSAYVANFGISTKTQERLNADTAAFDYSVTRQQQRQSAQMECV